MLILPWMFPFRSHVEDEALLLAKQAGFSDKQIGKVFGVSEDQAREMRSKRNIKPWVKQVGTGARYSSPAA